MRSTPTAPTRRAWIEIDTGALARNYARIAERVGTRRDLIPMVKADGYGLGAVRVMRALEPLEPWAYGVATAREGHALRAAGCDRRVVVFSPCLAVDRPAIRREELEPVLGGEGALDELERPSDGSEPPLPVHVEVDTGMGRLGLPASRAEDWAPRLRRLVSAGRIRIESTFTHFHSAEDDPEATSGQWSRFQAATREMEAAGLETGPRHAANSAAVFRHPETLADLARPGIHLYGGGFGEPAPEAVVRVRARVLEVRDVPPGSTVSYGATYRTGSAARLVTLGIGYGDGLRRELSNRGEALVAGRRAPIRGRVCMDTTVVEVSRDTAVEPGDVATLLGTDGEESITLGEMSEWCETIDYEILTGWSPRLPRTTSGAGDPVARGRRAGDGAPEGAGE